MSLYCAQKYANAVCRNDVYANARQDTNVSLWKCINYRQADIENIYFTTDGSIQSKQYNNRIREEKQLI